MGATVFVSSAHAQVPVIRPGREPEVMALTAPYTLGETIEGYVLDGISIDRAVIYFRLRSPERGEPAADQLTLHHPDDAPDGAARTPSFAIASEGDPASQAARDALIEAIRTNDDGAFWEPTVTAVLDHAVEHGELAEPQQVRTSPLPYVGLALGAVIVALLGIFLGGPPRDEETPADATDERA